MLINHSPWQRLKGVVAVAVCCIGTSLVTESGLHTRSRQPVLTTTAPTQESLHQQERSDATETHGVQAARQTARRLHEAFGGALQVMHRDYFRENERMKLPSKSLEDVFAEMARTHQIELRWLAVNANAMSVNHEPKSKFDKHVVSELSGDKDEYDEVEDGVLKFAGAIPLSDSCVRCHVRSRTSNDEKKAALVITVPIENGTK